METLIENFLDESGVLRAEWARAIISFGILLATFVLRRLFSLIISRKLLSITEKVQARTLNQVLRALNPSISAVFLIGGVYLAISVFHLPHEPFDVRKLVDESARVAFIVTLMWALLRFTDVLADLIGEKLGAGDEVLKRQFFPLIRRALRVFVIVMGSLLVIQNLGYSVGSLLTGLGIGGLAVALAAQETLASIFGSLVMLTDRPFRVGDWIQVGDIDGDVEEMGFRSTRVRTWSKSLVTIPNKKLADSVIENWAVMPKRRIKQTLSLTYDTSPEKMRAYVKAVREFLNHDEAVHPDLVLVYFNQFGPSSLDVLVYYFTKSTRWVEHLEARERHNLRFMEIAQEIGVEFAFPSQTLYWGPEQKPGLSPEVHS